MLFRFFAFSSLLAAAIGYSPAHVTSANRDGSTVQAAAQRLGREPVAQVTRWLLHRDSVRSAVVGRDHLTIEITFRDGARSAILSPILGRERFSGARMIRYLRPAIRQAAPSTARALVLEPFAGELHLPPGAGSGEASDLTAAGLRVDGPLADAAVTPATLSTLAQYNVVYMHTHTGVDQNGAGVLATGEPASCAPYVSADGTIATVGVAGSTQCFHAITAAFVRQHVGQFPTNAIVYVNGCDLLDAADFLQVLSDHGVGVTLSWNGEATGFDGYLSSLALFNQLGQGVTVSQALTTLYANHYGTSQTQGHTATLGYSGNGSLTLQEAAAGGPGHGTMPTSTPRPTDTPVNTPPSTPIPPTIVPSSTVAPVGTNTPVPTPTGIPVMNTPLPTDTATPAPSTTAHNLPVLRSVIPIVKPGNAQTVAVRNLSPGSTGTLVVRFPNGDKLLLTAMADSHGTATFTFVQAASKLTRHRQTAALTVTGDGPYGSFLLHDSYHLAFGRIDVSAQPRKVAAGRIVTVWIHTAPRTAVVALVRVAHRQDGRLQGKTGSGGWVELSYRMSRMLHHGQKVMVRAEFHSGSRLWHTATSVQVT